MTLTKLRVSNIFTDIEGFLPPELYEQLREKMSFRPKGFEFSTLFNRWIKDKDGVPIRRMWDGYRRQIWKYRGYDRHYFPTGLLSIVRKFFVENSIEHQFLEHRHKPEATMHLTYADGFKQRDYQQKIVTNACEIGRGIIQLATGGGKTACAEGIIKQLGVKPVVFFVTSKDLLTQAKESFEEVLRENGKPIVVGQIGGGIIDIRDINVMTIQTAVRALGKKYVKFDADDNADDQTPIEKRKEDILNLLTHTKLSFSDECQHWRAEICQLVARSLKESYYTYGMSATPYRDEGDDLIIQACFGNKIAEINASQLIKAGWLVKPSIKIVHVRGPKSPFRQWQQLYKDQVSENEEYNTMVSNIANAYVQNNRLVLVLVQQLAHGKRLANTIPGSIFLSGKSSKKKRQEGINQLRNRKISCIVSTVIFDEGIDVRPLDTVILSGQGKSRVRAMQRIGRILRPFEGKTTATCIDFRIHQKYLLQHSIEREKMYRTESEFIIEEIDP